MAKRHDARLAAVSVIYAWQMGNALSSDLLELFLQQNRLKGTKADFAKELINGTKEFQEQIDALIIKNLKNWNFERIGQIEKAVLRLAIFEILHTSLDLAVIINEALEITKQLADEQSIAFINAILDKVKNERNETLRSPR